MTPADVGPWRWAVMRSELGRSAFAVAMALAVRMDADGTIPARYAVGVRRIGMDARVNKDTAAAAIRELVAGGWLLEVQPRKGRRPARHRAALPAVATLPPGHNANGKRPNSGDTGNPLRPGPSSLCPNSDPVASEQRGHHQHYQQESSSGRCATCGGIGQVEHRTTDVHGRPRLELDTCPDCQAAA